MSSKITWDTDAIVVGSHYKYKYRRGLAHITNNTVWRGIQQPSPSGSVPHFSSDFLQTPQCERFIRGAEKREGKPKTGKGWGTTAIPLRIGASFLFRISDVNNSSEALEEKKESQRRERSGDEQPISPGAVCPFSLVSPMQMCHLRLTTVVDLASLLRTRTLIVLKPKSEDKKDDGVCFN